MAEGVPTNNQRGRRSGPCRLWGGLDKARHIVPTALLVRVQCFRKSLHKAVQGPSTRPIVVSMIIGSYCRRRRRLTIFEPDEMKFGVLFRHICCSDTLSIRCTPSIFWRFVHPSLCIHACTYNICYKIYAMYWVELTSYQTVGLVVYGLQRCRSIWRRIRLWCLCHQRGNRRTFLET